MNAADAPLRFGVPRAAARRTGLQARPPAVSPRSRSVRLRPAPWPGLETRPTSRCWPAWIAYLVLALSLPAAARGAEPVHVAVGSKAFTESVILGELARLLAVDAGLEAVHREQLGGTIILWEALERGEIDAYPEYTGTLSQEILKQPELKTVAELRAALAPLGIGITSPLGFNNTYALGMLEATAERLGVRTISDLQGRPELRCGFTNEFLKREEGWPSLRRVYALPQTSVRGLDHQLAYRALAAGDIQLTDLAATDAEIPLLGLRTLEDDREHFPKYEAVYLYRLDLAERAPAWPEALERLAGTLPEPAMIALNRDVAAKKSSEQGAAAGHLAAVLGVQVPLDEPGLAERIARRTLEHLYLVVVSLAAAVCVAGPLGVLAAKRPALGQAILAVAEVIQTIPGLALLVLLIPLVAAIGFRAVGPAPAIVALFLYSLLPILRNTYAGIQATPKALLESAEALGLSRWSQLWLVELPLASRTILAGVKTTAAINVGYAALGGLIGAGGYGEPIMTGLRLNDVPVMLEGAIPAAVLALIVKGIFEGLERWLTPRGLRAASAG